jgi:ornithine cyclodeaminase/alanine dehydrogenase
MSLEMIYLSRADVEGLGVGMAEVLAAVEEGFRLKGLKQTEMPPKPGIHTRDNCFIHAMPAYVQGLEAAGMKWVSGYPGNLAKGLPYITGLLILNDAETGVPIAVMDCAWITAMRTGASVGVAARYLAKPNSTVVAFLGCGVQARPSLLALAEVLPSLREVRCYDLFPAATARFIADMAEQLPGLQYTTCQSPRELCQRAEVVVSAIPIVTKPEPPLDAGMLEEGALAVSLDYDSAWTTAAMRECDRFVSDDIDQLLNTKAHHVYFGGIPDTIHADLGELVARLKVGRQHDLEKIFAMNMGIAIDDMVTAQVLYERALATGAGTRLPL